MSGSPIGVPAARSHTRTVPSSLLETMTAARPPAPGTPEDQPGEAGTGP